MSQTTPGLRPSYGGAVGSTAVNGDDSSKVKQGLGLVGAAGALTTQVIVTWGLRRSGRGIFATVISFFAGTIGFITALAADKNGTASSLGRTAVLGAAADVGASGAELFADMIGDTKELAAEKLLKEEQKRSHIEQVRSSGLKRGQEIGVKEGFQGGFQEGIKEGREEGREEVFDSVLNDEDGRGAELRRLLLAELKSHRASKVETQDEDEAQARFAEEQAQEKAEYQAHMIEEQAQEKAEFQARITEAQSQEEARTAPNPLDESAFTPPATTAQNTPLAAATS